MGFIMDWMNGKHIEEDRIRRKEQADRFFNKLREDMEILKTIINDGVAE